VGWIKAGSQPTTYEALAACFPETPGCGTWRKGTFTEKGHGRLTTWKVEVCRLGPEMRAYLESLGWPGVQVIGRYRVKQRDIATGEEKQGERFWLAGAPWDIWVRLGQPSEQAWTHFWWQALRGHWGIENRLFYVLDVTWREDAQWGRWIAKGLHLFRVWATALLRRWGFRWIPTGQRTCDAAADALMAWIVQGKLSRPCVNS